MTRAVQAGLRAATAGLLATIAGIHLDLWANYGYQHIPTIGVLFLLDGIAGSILALACLAAPRRVVGPLAAASVLFAAGTLAALVVSVNVGLFGFTESTTAPLFDQAVAVEAAAIMTGSLLALTSRARRSPSQGRGDRVEQHRTEGRRT